MINEEILTFVSLEDQWIGVLGCRRDMEEELPVFRCILSPVMMRLYAADLSLTAPKSSIVLMRIVLATGNSFTPPLQFEFDQDIETAISPASYELTAIYLNT